MLKHLALITCLALPGGQPEVWQPLAPSQAHSAPVRPQHHWWDLYCYTNITPLEGNNHASRR